MNLFEQILVDLLIAGEAVGPIFIKSAHGITLLNATEEGVSAILEAHQQNTKQRANDPVIPTS